MDRGHTAKGLSDVAINNKSGMDQALRHLRELGHKKIGYIGGSAGLTISDHRVQAFIRALKRVDMCRDQSSSRSGTIDYRCVQQIPSCFRFKTDRPQC